MIMRTPIKVAPGRWAIFLVTGMALGLFFPGAKAESHHPRDSQRYLVYNIWTWNHEAEGFAAFKAEAAMAKQVGFNALKIHILWSLCETQPGVYDFSALDARLDFVWNQLNLPVAVYIDLTRHPPRQGPDAVVGPEHWQRDQSGRLAMSWTDRPMIAFASAPAVSQATAFVKALVRHCESRRDAGRVFFYEPVFSPYAEIEYFPDGVYDYSIPARDRFRAWLATRYGDVESLSRTWATPHTDFAAIEPPPDFSGPIGRDWYRFRHAMLKQAIDSVIGAIKEAAPDRPVSLRFGSVFDARMRHRATAWFPDLCDAADIVFVDDAPHYDHRWSMDLLRGSLPHKRIGNEVDGPNNADDAVYGALISQSFEHGAQFVTVANWNAASLEKRRSLFENMAKKWLSSPVTQTPPNTPTLIVDSDTVFSVGYDAAQRQHNEMLSKGVLMVNVVMKMAEAANKVFRPL